MNDKTVDRIKLTLARGTERMFFLISKDMDVLLRAKAEKENMKVAHIIRTALAEYLTKQN